MKTLVKVSALAIIVCTITLFSCKKSDQNSTTGITPKPNLHALAKQNGDNGLSLQLHRANGNKHGGAWNGYPCNCVFCFGICTGHLTEDSDGGVDMATTNVIMHDNGNGTGTLYILETPDDDVKTDPTMYVDNNVICQNASGTETVAIKAGQYRYTDEAGTKTFFGVNFNYIGTAVVSIQ